MTQTTTTVSAGMPARMQKSMDRVDGGSKMQTTTAISADVPQQTQHITKGRSLWIEEVTRFHDADDHCLFRGHASKNAEVYGSGKRRGSTNHYAAL